MKNKIEKLKIDLSDGFGKRFDMDDPRMDVDEQQEVVNKINELIDKINKISE